MAEAATAERVTPTTWQARVLSIPEHFDVFLGGGRGGGKSFACLLLALRHVEQYAANARILIVRRDFPSLRDLEGEARGLFRTAYGKALGHNAAMHLFKFPNGATVQFDQIENAGDFAKFQGQSFSLIFADEAGQWPDPQPIDMLRSSLRSKAGVPTRMVLSANPGGPGHHWLYQRHVAAVRPFVPYTARASERTFVTAPSTLSDNPHLPTDYGRQIAAATATDGELQRAWLDGDWAINRGAFFSFVLNPARVTTAPWPTLPSTHALQRMRPWEQRNIKHNASALGTKPSFGWQYTVALDHGSAAPCVTYFVARSPGAEGPDGVYYPRDSLVLFDEIAFVDGGNLNTGMNLTVDVMAREIVERCQAWGIKARGSADDATFAKHGSTQGSLADEYRRGGLMFQRAAKGDRISGWERMKRLLASAGEPDQPGLYVSERCAYWWQTVPFLPRDKKRPEDVDTSGADHAADACRYAVVAQIGPMESSTRIKGLM